MCRFFKSDTLKALFFRLNNKMHFRHLVNIESIAVKSTLRRRPWGPSALALGSVCFCSYFPRLGPCFPWKPFPARLCVTVGPDSGGYIHVCVISPGSRVSALFLLTQRKAPSLQQRAKCEQASCSCLLPKCPCVPGPLFPPDSREQCLAHSRRIINL